MTNPKVSVIIPVYNTAAYLAETLESILNQTYTEYEIIVVDDGSTDDSAKVAKSFGPPIHYVYQQNAGAAVARNHGVRLARGDFLAFLDADDLWTPKKLETQMQVFEQRPELDAVFGYVEHFISPDVDEETARKIQCPAKPMPGKGFSSLMLIRKEAFLRVGYFDKQYRVGEGIDWFAKASEKGLKSVVSSQIMARRRLHKSNIGMTYREEYNSYARVMKAALDRRRKAASREK